MLPFSIVNQYGNTAPSPAVIRQVKSGQNHNIMLTSTGDMYVQGLSNYGQCGTGSTGDVVNFKLIDSGVNDIGTGYNTSLYRKGSNIYGAGLFSSIDGSAQKNTWTSVDGLFSTLPGSVTDIKEIKPSAAGLFVLMNSGKLYCRGLGTKGELGVSSNRDTWTLSAEDVSEVHCGYECSLILKTNGDLYGTGTNSRGQLATGDTNNLSVWTRLSTGVLKAYAGYYNNIIVKADGIYGSGAREYGILGDGYNTTTASNYLGFVRLQLPAGSYITGEGFMYTTGNAVIVSGTAYGAGSNAAVGGNGANAGKFVAVRGVVGAGLTGIAILANGILVNDGMNIWGAGNGRLLPGIGSGTYNSFVKCVMPF